VLFVMTRTLGALRAPYREYSIIALNFSRLSNKLYSFLRHDHLVKLTNIELCGQNYSKDFLVLHKRTTTFKFFLVYISSKTITDKS
jgi:hypothetical protein